MILYFVPVYPGAQSSYRVSADEALRAWLPLRVMILALFYPDADNNIREYARYGTNYKHWPYSQRRIFPEKTLMRHPETDEWVQAGFGSCWFMNRRRETLSAFLFYGTEFVINVGGPSIQG